MNDKIAAEWVDIDAVRPWAKNPRNNEHAVPEVMASIKRFGFGAPLLVRRANGEIISGHTRHKAAVRLGLDRIPVRFLDLDEHEAHALALADNRLGELADWDRNLLGNILDDLVQSSVAIDTIGWDQSDLDQLRGIAPESADDPFQTLPTGAPEFHQMTFTLTQEQQSIVKTAIRKALSYDRSESTGNANKNGNALSYICERFNE